MRTRVAQGLRRRDRGLELAPMRPLVVGQLRPAQLELGVEPLRHGQLERASIVS